ncbi:Hpt domain-containing protein [Aliivibrio finisterrensis]|uniref:Hpt domain-containing protein n=1 Tax=Aliivibrio finisterrensis TaxID=511998 RepID=UPI0010216506|nr:Hpt domain-containing protein [Aliivibrio finisterrensis]RYU68192.1 Hpt domain-containing protein [Aliivibrio finisterrensis]RYU71893.1 Hpt domain-containing protein [Aliivibrio finisterrensis]RYU75502.1 Hpt domain-containing protein [Aliivibrio finisterrensis]
MINISALEDMFEGDEAIIKELFSLYLNENACIIQKIRLEYDSDNLTALYNTAHTLSGALGNLLEIDTISQIKEIERLSKSDTKPDVGIIESVISELKNISDQMHQYLS